jgi:hypothetical protein
MRLFTIGDSISQGFRSLAAAQTDQCFSTLLARVLGADEYCYPTWDRYGLPINLEAIMRRLEGRYGPNIGGLEWLTVLSTINGLLDEGEEYYERGNGSEIIPYPSAPQVWSNVAFYGATVADSWQLTPALCLQAIAQEKAKTGGDNVLQGPNAPFYRSALRMLNPQLAPEHMNKSQLDWVKTLAEADGIENLVIWLGANNCLGTIIGLNINQTLNDPSRRPHTLPYFERDRYKWNLWHPEDFAAEYGEFLARLTAALSKNKAPNGKVFVATIPLVTIAPLAKGVGDTMEIKRKGAAPGAKGDIYFKYYTYFPFDEEFARKTSVQLSLNDAVHIDSCIREYNTTIKTLTENLPGFHVVDMAAALDAMAWKRNDGNPTYQFPAFFDFLHPRVDTKYYHSDEQGRLRQGGIFSLDGVHPTAVGHGIMAWEFLKVMKAEKVQGANPDALPWAEIFRSDTLYSSPIRLMHEIYEHGRLAEHLVKLIKTFGRGKE